MYVLDSVVAYLQSTWYEWEERHEDAHRRAKRVDIRRRKYSERGG